MPSPCLAAAGFRFLPIVSRWGCVPPLQLAYRTCSGMGWRPTVTVADPIGVATLHASELRPGRVCSLLRDRGIRAGVVRVTPASSAHVGSIVVILASSLRL
jgi:hypothetical protein